MHLKSYQAAHKIDNGAVGVAQTFGSKEALWLYVEKQQELAKEVVVLYEAGPLGYKLYRELKASAIECLVCAPRSGEQKRKRRKNNSIDARTLTSDLFNYLHGKSMRCNGSECRARPRSKLECRAANRMRWWKNASASARLATPFY